MQQEAFIDIPASYGEIDHLFARITREGWKKLVLTSAQSGEGVSSIAYALAQRAAMAGLAVLYADFNGRNPYTREALALGPGPEAGPETGPAVGAVASPSQHRILQPEGSSIDFLPVPAATLPFVAGRHKQALAEALDACAADYDLVILDAPPVLHLNRGAVPTDILASTADATILVVLTAKTSINRIDAALNTLDAAGARPDGILLNDRYFPSLQAELMRQAGKLHRLWPACARYIRKQLSAMAFLRPDI